MPVAYTFSPSLAGFLLVILSATPVAAELPIRQVAAGVYTGPAPENRADLSQLHRLGVRTVVDMRPHRAGSRRWERDQLNLWGIAYCHLPVGLCPKNDATPLRVVAMMSDPQRQSIYVHCTLGRDRTGLVTALFRTRVLGWSVQAAYQAMERQQFNPLLRGLDRYFWRHACR